LIEFSTISKQITGISELYPYIRDGSKKCRIDLKALVTPVSLGLGLALIDPSLPFPSPPQVFAGMLPAPAPVFSIGVDELPGDHAYDSQQRYGQGHPDRNLRTLHSRSLGIPLSGLRADGPPVRQ